ncbi:hypothetical protein [Paenibacillus terrigena]|uniref:hypothetical protein n=1 Tax=Paenibacillus terrigena TaxID=369333 RepID=UPI00037DDFF3|nr:hypothetical protein [Paenibacillus terrigena]
MGISIGENIEVKVGAVQEQQIRMIVGTIEEIVNTVPRSAIPTGEETGTTLTIPQESLRIKVMDSELQGEGAGRNQTRKTLTPRGSGRFQ